jgi:predicted RNase H-like HicB family nuclease
VTVHAQHLFCHARLIREILDNARNVCCADLKLALVMIDSPSVPRIASVLLVMKKTHFRFNIFLRPEPEGGFTAVVPALPGCVTYGRTLGEAKKMAKDAICGYIESLKKHKEPIPSDDETLVASLDLEYAQTSRR